MRPYGERRTGPTGLEAKLTEIRWSRHFGGAHLAGFRYRVVVDGRDHAFCKDLAEARRVAVQAVHVTGATP